MSSLNQTTMKHKEKFPGSQIWVTLEESSFTLLTLSPQQKIHSKVMSTQKASVISHHPYQLHN